jgi:hypothetical protein
MEDYKDKFDIMLRRIPYTMYIFEVTKMCGYVWRICNSLQECVIAGFSPVDPFLIVTVLELPQSNIFLMNPDTKVKYEIPKSDFFTVRDLITKFQNDPELKKSIKPLYDLPADIVHKIYYDEGHTRAGL